MKKRRGQPKRRCRYAQLIAEAVNVCCPWCSAPQPNRTDGSEQWMAADFAVIVVTPVVDRADFSETFEVECVSCDELMLISKEPKVMFQ